MISQHNLVALTLFVVIGGVSALTQELVVLPLVSAVDVLLADWNANADTYAKIWKDALLSQDVIKKYDGGDDSATISDILATENCISSDSGSTSCTSGNTILISYTVTAPSSASTVAWAYRDSMVESLSSTTAKDSLKESIQKAAGATDGVDAFRTATVGSTAISQTSYLPITFDVFAMTFEDVHESTQSISDYTAAFKKAIWTAGLADSFTTVSAATADNVVTLLSSGVLRPPSDNINQVQVIFTVSAPNVWTARKDLISDIKSRISSVTNALRGELTSTTPELKNARCGGFFESMLVRVPMQLYMQGPTVQQWTANSASYGSALATAVGTVLGPKYTSAVSPLANSAYVSAGADTTGLLVKFTLIAPGAWERRKELAAALAAGTSTMDKSLQDSDIVGFGSAATSAVAIRASAKAEMHINIKGVTMASMANAQAAYKTEATNALAMGLQNHFPDGMTYIDDVTMKAPSSSVASDPMVSVCFNVVGPEVKDVQSSLEDSFNAQVDKVTAALNEAGSNEDSQVPEFRQVTASTVGIVWAPTSAPSSEPTKKPVDPYELTAAEKRTVLITTILTSLALVTIAGLVFYFYRNNELERKAIESARCNGMKLRAQKGEETGEGVINPMTCAGEWTGPRDANGFRHGWGIMKYESGPVYEGNMSRNSRHGSGRCTFSNGDVYEGTWDSDLEHGMGVLQDENGAVKQEGTWIYGAFQDKQ